MSRRGKGAGSAGAGATELLDEAEQQKQVDEIRATATRQATNGRQFFYVGLLATSVLLSCCLVYNILFPLEMEHQQHFRDVVPHWCFQLYYLAATLCMIFAALVAKRGFSSLPFALRLAGCTLTAVLLVAWGAVFFIYPPPLETHWPLLWLPLAAPFGLLLGIYVDRDAASLLADVEKLESMRYTLKSI